MVLRPKFATLAVNSMKMIPLPVSMALAACIVFVMACSGDSANQTHHTPIPGETPAPTPTATPPAIATAEPAVASVEVEAPTADAERAATDRLAADFRFVLFQGEETLGGKEMALSELEGRPLVLNFWARFCTPCWSEMPELQDFYEEYGGRVGLLGIDVGQFTGLGSPKDAGRLLNSLGITYPAGYTDDAQVVRDYRIRAMPTTAFVTAGGELFRLWTGSITREEVTAIVQEMLEGE